MSKEIWKDVVGYEGLYQVSNIGNVKSLNYRNTGKHNILKKSNNRGYKFLCLSKSGYIKMFLVHRLVCIAFIENLNNKKEVNHKNGVKDDNRVENLEWVTKSENEKHKIHTLGHKTHFHKVKQIQYVGKFGKEHPVSKKVIQYTKEGKFIKLWDCISDVKKELGIRQPNITNCCKGIRKTAGGYKWEKYSLTQ